MAEKEWGRVAARVFAAVQAEVGEERFEQLSVPEVDPGDPRASFERMCRRVYALGLPPWIVERHWEATRRALLDCDPAALAGMTDQEAAAVLESPEVLRNRAKLEAVRHNARVVCALLDTYGDLEAYRDAMQAEEVQGLLDDLRDRFRLVGPVSAARIAQELGADCLVPHPAVVRVLSRLGWCPPEAAAATRQEVAAIAAQGLAEPYPVARLGATLLAFASGRWGASGPCGEAPQCGECPVWRDCPRVGVKAVDAA